MKHYKGLVRRAVAAVGVAAALAVPTLGMDGRPEAADRLAAKKRKGGKQQAKYGRISDLAQQPAVLPRLCSVR